MYSKKDMDGIAKSYISCSYVDNTDYYEYYKNKYITNNDQIVNDVGNNSSGDLRNRLLNFRNERSQSMNIPAYYIFTNEELENLLLIRPKTLEELRTSYILSPIKVKTHGEAIVKEIIK